MLRVHDEILYCDDECTECTIEIHFECHLLSSTLVYKRQMVAMVETTLLHEHLEDSCSNMCGAFVDGSRLNTELAPQISEGSTNYTNSGKTKVCPLKSNCILNRGYTRIFDHDIQCVGMISPNSDLCYMF